MLKTGNTKSGHTLAAETQPFGSAPSETNVTTTIPCRNCNFAWGAILNGDSLGQEDDISERSLNMAHRQSFDVPISNSC